MLHSLDSEEQDAGSGKGVGKDRKIINGFS